MPPTENMSLLSKSEIQYLQNQKQVSKRYEYKLKSIIHRKVSAFLQNELPLLLKCHLMELDTFKSLGKAKVVGPNPTQGFLK
ncbi:MAG: hypothetical protein H0X50_10280 [Nitrosopumilus sp.]|nr:hypothetical protein [Nitrosopumilus sp.]